MSHPTTFAWTAFFAAIAVSISAAGASEVERPMADLPTAVQATIKSTAGKGTITKTVRETEKDGSVLYEVAYTIGGRKYEAEVSPAGKLLVVDEQIELKEAPKAVQNTIVKHVADGKIIKIEKASKGREVFYETEFTRGDKEHEVKVAPDGKLLASE
jgi:hypothetical protein